MVVLLVKQVPLIEGGNPKQEKDERGMMMGEDFDALEEPKITFVKKEVNQIILG